MKRRGQAMLEYSSLIFFLFVTAVGSMSIDVNVNGEDVKILEAFLRALQAYYDSFHLVLNSPFP